MVQYAPAPLDASFAALSDATRRGVLLQLGRADASITDLAEKFHMTLTGMKKHVGVLEQAGLVTTEKVGRVRTCKLGPRRLEEETAWIESYRQLWAARFDALDEVVQELQGKERNRVKNPTTVERKSERELVVTRTIRRPGAPRVRGSGPGPSCSGSGGCRSRPPSPSSPARWTLASEGHTAWCSASIADHGVLRQVPGGDTVLASRLDQRRGRGGAAAVTTVTFEERDGKTLVTMQISIPRRKLSTPPSPPGRRTERPRS